MNTKSILRIVAGLAVVGAFSAWAMAQNADGARRGARSAQSRPAAATHKPLGELPALADQTIRRQNSPQDKLRIDITHSHRQAGKYVAFVRIAWGDLDNQIKGGGKKYYSDWDGQLALDAGTAKVVRKIAFDSGGGGAKATRRGATSRPAAIKAGAGARRGAASRPSGEPGPGSGRDELLEKSGPKIEWKAGVVGAFDGLLVKITSDKPDISGTIKAGKFTVPVKITPRNGLNRRDRRGR